MVAVPEVCWRIRAVQEVRPQLAFSGTAVRELEEFAVGIIDGEERSIDKPKW
jgi:hypothetical protein